jgi:hypothetical protein
LTQEDARITLSAKWIQLLSGTFSQMAHALKVMQRDYAAKLDVE